MKKYIILPVIMLLFVAASFAQTSRRSSGKKSTKARTEVKAKKRSSKSRSISAVKSRSSSAKKSTPQKSKQRAVKKSSSSKASGKSKARSAVSKKKPKKSNSSSRSSSVKRKLPVIKKTNRSSSDKRSSSAIRKNNRSSSNKRVNDIRKTVNNSNSNRANGKRTNRTTNDMDGKTRIDNRIEERKAARKNIAHRTNSGYERISRKARHKGVWRVNRPLSIEIRRVRYPYRRPRIVNVYWTRNMYRDYVGFYPFHTHWYMDIGSTIESVSSYDAAYYEGEVKRVYGKVEEVYYSPEDRNYYLFFGAPYPYHDFSVVISRRDAKRLSLFPEWYFDNQHICVTGLITWFEDKPEMIIKSPSQIHRY